MIIEHGPNLGFYHHGKPVPSYIVDQDGTHLYFERTAVETNGGVELRQLAVDEVVIAPGLIYRRGGKP